MNFLIAPTDFGGLFVGRVVVAESVFLSSRVMPVSELWKERVGFARIVVSVCRSC